MNKLFAKIDAKALLTIGGIVLTCLGSFVASAKENVRMEEMQTEITKKVLDEINSDKTKGL